MRCIPMLTDASALEMAERVGDGLWRLPTSIVRFSHTLGQHPGLRRFRDAGRNRALPTSGGGERRAVGGVMSG